MNKFILLGALLWMGLSLQGAAKTRLYLPQVPSKRVPVVIVCPGGSYHYLGTKVEGTRVAKWLNANGIAALVLRYRVAPSRFPAPMEDLQQAIHFCRSNADSLGFDPEKVGVMGFSAGGHLAGLSAVYGEVNYWKQSPNDPISVRPNFVAMIYPVVTMSDETIVHEKSRRGLIGSKPSLEMLDSMSLENRVHTEMPALFLVHSKNDDVVDYRNSVYFSKALDSVGCEHQFVLYENGTHGFGIDRAKGQDALNWPRMFLKWFNNLEK